MPCGDGGVPYPSREPELENMLCGLCKRVEKMKLRKLIDMDPVLALWWKEHLEKDNARKATEKACKLRKKIADAAKKRLSKAELEALGIR